MIAAFTLLACGTAVLAEPFNNESVIALSSSGIGDDVLLAKINSLPCSYDVSTEEIIRLKNSGVSNQVIAAMVSRCTNSTRAQGAIETSSDPMIKRSPGLYINQSIGANDIRVIRPTIIGGGKVSGNGSILFPYKLTLILSQESAQTIAPSNKPVFYFYFETADNRVGDFGTSDSIAAQSPSEFSLVQFKVKKGQRELEYGKVQGMEARAGIDPKKAIPFSVAELGDGIFRVEVNAPLARGQYGFLLQAGSKSFRIYDFAVN